MESKTFWQSKTFWVNALAMIASVAGVFNVDIDPELQTTIIGVIMGAVNIILRFTTKAPVTLTKQQ